MTIPKFESTRDKWATCRKCGISELSCKGLARDRQGFKCCPDCTHRPEEEKTNAAE